MSHSTPNKTQPPRYWIDVEPSSGPDNCEIEILGEVVRVKVELPPYRPCSIPENEPQK